jgi:hypothetical protein
VRELDSGLRRNDGCNSAMHSALFYLIPVLLGALAAPGFAPVGLYPLPILTLAGLFWLAR